MLISKVYVIQSTNYYVCRSVLFGLWRLYLRISPDYYNNGNKTEYEVNYTPQEYASKFFQRGSGNACNRLKK